MKAVTQKARFRQTVINYAENHGVTRSANRYDVTRQYIYRWKKYDGTFYSLTDKSHRARIKANLRYVKKKSLHKSRGVVDKTSTKMVYSVGNKLVSYSNKN